MEITLNPEILQYFASHMQQSIKSFAEINFYVHLQKKTGDNKIYALQWPTSYGIEYTLKWPLEVRSMTNALSFLLNE